MAKGEKGRVRVFFAEFEGSDETLQDGMKALTSAVQKTFQGPPPEIKVVSLPEGSKPEDLAEVIEGEYEQVEEDVGIDAKKKTSKAGKRKAPTYRFVTDLNLRPTGEDSLKDFCSARKLGDNQAYTAAFVYYLEKTLSVEKITADHLYTCYKEVSVKSPTNIGQVATNTANRNGWIACSKSEGYKISVQGENFIEHDSLSGVVKDTSGTDS